MPKEGALGWGRRGSDRRREQRPESLEGPEGREPDPKMDMEDGEAEDL